MKYIFLAVCAVAAFQASHAETDVRATLDQVYEAFEKMGKQTMENFDAKEMKEAIASGYSTQRTEIRLIGLESVFMSSLGVVKVVIFYRHREQVAFLLNNLGFFISKTFTSKIVRATMISFGLSMFGVPGFWTINALAFGHFKTPMPYWFPFEINTMGRFVPAFILGVVCLVSTVYTNTLIDNSVLLIVSQLCARVLVLRKSLHKLGLGHQRPKSKMSVPEGVIEGNMHSSFAESDDDLELIDGLTLITTDSDQQLLKECVQEHVKIIKLIRIADHLLHVIFFFQVFLSMFLSCISIFAVTQLEKLNWACYSNSWYLMSPSLRRTQGILQEFTKKPFMFRGLYMFNMSHQIFLRVIQDSVSYFMFLRTFTS